MLKQESIGSVIVLPRWQFVMSGRFRDQKTLQVTLLMYKVYLSSPRWAIILSTAKAIYKLVLI